MPSGWNGAAMPSFGNSWKLECSDISDTSMSPRGICRRYVTPAM